MDINEFENYAVHVLRPQNTESGELELKEIGGKCKDKIKFVLNNYLINAELNQITSTIKEYAPPLTWKLYNITWTNYNPIPLLEDKAY